MCLAIPGKIETITEHGEPHERQAKVDFGGIRKDISLAFVPEAELGQYVIVHVGFALSIVQEDEAKQVFKYLEEMGELDEIKEVAS